MIALNATAIRNQFNLNTKQLQNFVVLELPDGVSIVAEISADAAQHLMELSGEEGASPQPTPQPDPIPTPEHNGVMVEWAKLPDEFLAPAMKKALTVLGTERTVSGPVLQAMINDIANKFTPDDWATVLGEEPAQPQVQEPSVNIVGWSEEPPRRQIPQPRTVPKDEAGNPIVPGLVEVHESEEDYGAAQF